MTRAEKIFEESTKHLGGKYFFEDSYTSLFTLVRYTGMNIIESLREQNPKFPKVHIDLIDNDSFNACAFKNKDMYFIGINIGTIVELYLFFNYILAFPNILSFIGDSKLENKPKSESLSDIISPKCEIRKNYANGLFHFAILFLIMHEYAHIVNGHIDYKNSKTGSSFIFEMVKSCDSGLNSQAIEFDADNFAAFVGITNIIGRYKNRFNLNPITRPFFNSLDEAIFLWAFSTYTVFRHLVHFVYDFDNLDKYSHPFPGFRQHSSIFVAIKSVIIKSEFSDDFEKIDKSITFF